MLSSSRRLAVEDSEGKLVGILPQSHLIKMIIPYVNCIPRLG